MKSMEFGSSKLHHITKRDVSTWGENRKGDIMVAIGVGLFGLSV